MEAHRAPQAGTAYLDMTDVLRFLREHVAVSGIQRVVVEVAPRLARFVPCKFVAYSPERGCFVLVDTQGVEALIDAVVHATDDTKAAVTAQAQALLDSMSDAAELRADTGDVLAILGSAWGLSGLFQDIQRLKGEGAAVVVLLFDLIPVLMPGFPEGVVHEFRQYIPRVAHLADRAPGISASTRTDFERYCEARGWEAPPGAATTLAADQWNPERLRRMGLDPAPAWPRPYVLFVSTIEVRKNHILALRCWRRLIEQFGADRVPDLVCVGRLGWSVLEFLEEFESTQGLNGKIRILSSVPEAKLAALYRDCMFTIYPSLYEGWGLPVAESLQWGKPVVSASNSSLEEVGLDFARYFASDDVVAMTEVVGGLVADAGLLEADASRIAAQYRPRSWDDVADVILQEIAAAREQRRAVQVQSRIGQEYGVTPLRPFDGPPTGEHIAAFVAHERRLPLTGQTTSLDRFLEAERITATRQGRTRITITRPHGRRLFLVGSVAAGLLRNDLRFSGPSGTGLRKAPDHGVFVIDLGEGAGGTSTWAEVIAARGGFDGPPVHSFVIVDDVAEADRIVRTTAPPPPPGWSTRAKRRIVATKAGRAAVDAVRGAVNR